MAANHFSRLIQLLAIANLPLLARAGLGFGGYGQGFPGRVGPFDANSTRFLDVDAASNATGVFKIPGYDVSKPFPGEPIDGWTLRLAAVDLSHPDGYLDLAEYGIYTNPLPKVMVGNSLTIQAPDSLIETNDDGTKIVKTDPTWGMCMWNFGHPNDLEKDLYNNPTNKPLAEDGSCKGFLSDECIAALEKAPKYAYLVADSLNTTKGQFGSLTTCQILSPPDECGEHGPGNAGIAVGSYGGVPIPYLNGSVTMTDGWLFEQDRGELYNSTEDLHAFWDSMVLNYWVVLTAMVNATAMDPEAPWSERGTPLSRVHCVAPNGMGTGKGFTFSGVQSGNVQDERSKDGADHDESGGTTADDDDSGAEGVRPRGWVASALITASIVLGGWAW